jgi:ABC-type Fe3+/spermidine/putrescine transport system ATPase subunit
MDVFFEGVWKKYGDFTAVKDLQLKIESGALHFLLGPSGCGKTTSLRMLAGLESVSKGKILMGGRDVTKKSPQERGIGMVFQNYALWPHMTVRKNIEYGLKLRKLSNSTIKNRLDQVVAITQLERFIDHLPAQLSGGQQQRVALSRALAVRPNVLLLDEPLSNLDAKLRLEMRDNICRIHKKTGITTLYVTHDQKEALSMGTQVSVMYAGHLLQTASPRELYHRPCNPYVANFIGEANLIKGKITWRSNFDAKVDTPLGLMHGVIVDKELSIGDKALIAMRPEAVRIYFREGENIYENSFSAILTGDTYLGESEQFLMTTKEGSDIKATVFHNPDHKFKKGDTIKCSIEKKDILILKPNERLGPGT